MSMNPRLLRPTASGFSPRSIPGLALWLDASDPGVLYTTDAGPVTAVTQPTDIAGCALWLDASDPASITASGGAVTEWRDKTTNGRHHTAASAARPTTGTRTLNGLNVIDFDGTGNLLTGNSACLTMFQNVPHAAVFVVMKFDALTANQYFFEHKSTGAAARFQIFAQPGGALVLGGRRLDADSLGTISSTATTSPCIISGIADYANSDLFLRRDGATLASTTTFQTDGSTSNTTSPGHTLGGVSSLLMDGYIAEVVVYNTALTTADRARVESYLAAKWGIAGVHAPATASSDPVGYWGDKSGNGRTVVQSTASNRPLMTTGIINGKSVLRFDGSNDFLVQAAGSSFAFPYSLFVAYQSSDAAGSLAGNNRVTGAFVSEGLRKSAASTLHGIQQNGANTAEAFATAPSADCHVAELVFSGTSASLTYTVRANGGPTADMTVARARDDSAQSRRLEIGCVFIAGSPADLLAGDIAEVVAYGRTLSAGELSRVRQYLGRKYGVTLAPLVANADAQDWVNRVYANGGTVSTATAQAVDTFCGDIESAGLRSKFYRLSLMCGDNLLAALVPLYRSTSFGGTVLGLSTDDNVGFVSGDYTLAGSLNNATGSKYLRLNARPFSTLLPSGNDRQSGHVAVSCTSANTSPAGTSPLIGIQTAGSGEAYHVNARYSGSQFIFWGTRAINWTPSATSGRMNLINTRNSGRNSIYEAGVEGLGSTGATTTPDPDARFAVYASGSVAGADSVANNFTGRIYAYSVGDGLSSAEAAAYNTHLTTFLNAIGRTA